MKRYLILGLSTLLILTGIFLLVNVATTVKASGYGALQVTSNIKSSVTLDGKDIGQTPLCKCNQNELLKTGEYTLVITPEDKTQQPYSVKVTVNVGVLTAIERIFLPGALASTSILTLEKINSSDAQLFISSLPDGAMVTIDGNDTGVTPLLQDKIAPSEHEIEITKVGFEKKTLKVRTVQGYKLIGDVILGTANGGALPTVTPTPNPTAALSPTPSVATGPTIKILNTPTGFLRVRLQPSVGSDEIGRVNPGESYPYVDEQSGWYEIKLTNGSQGWISSQYAQKVEGQ